MVTRRGVSLAGAIALVTVPGIAFLQSAGKVSRIGVLGLGTSTLDPKNPVWAAFIDELRKRGYEEGRNLAFEFRLAIKDNQDFESAAAELVALKVDVIFTIGGTRSVQAAKKATTTIPIVMYASTDPVAAGLVRSLARPGTNVTGSSSQGDLVVGKNTELLLELVPKASRIALLSDPGWSAREGNAQQAQRAAAAKGVILTNVDVKDAATLQHAFMQFEKRPPDGLVLASGGQMVALADLPVRQATSSV